MGRGAPRARRPRVLSLSLLAFCLVALLVACASGILQPILPAPLRDLDTNWTVATYQSAGGELQEETATSEPANNSLSQLPEGPTPSSLVTGAAESGREGEFSAETDGLDQWTDLVVATFTDERRLDVVKGQRTWRKSLRTYVASNLSEVPAELAEEGRQHRETWGFYPDSHKRKDVQWPGDHRGALAPFLAHQVFGDTYKWMLYGDDDTLFFLQGVRRLVRGLDPDLPYVITDWIYEPQPNVGLRCMPCGFNATGYNVSAAPYVAPMGCPCTTALLCKADPLQYFSMHKDYFTENFRPLDCSARLTYKDVPRRTGHLALNGGAGALLSVGLLRALGWQQMEACVLELRGDRGSDSHITYCIWHGGYGLTGLPGSFYSEPQKMYQKQRLFHRSGPMDIYTQLEEALKVSVCGVGDIDCQHRVKYLDNVVSSHGSARGFKTWQEAREMNEKAMTTYHRYVAYRTKQQWHAT